MVSMRLETLLSLLPTVYWTQADWDRTAVTVTEPDVLDSPNMGRWRAVGRRADGVLVYSKETP